jgi:hypothetical protein
MDDLSSSARMMLARPIDDLDVSDNISNVGKKVGEMGRQVYAN